MVVMAGADRCSCVAVMTSQIDRILGDLGHEESPVKPVASSQCRSYIRFQEAAPAVWLAARYESDHPALQLFCGSTTSCRLLSATAQVMVSAEILVPDMLRTGLPCFSVRIPRTLLTRTHIHRSAVPGRMGCSGGPPEQPEERVLFRNLGRMHPLGIRL